jgi:hypothetical protein
MTTKRDLLILAKTLCNEPEVKNYLTQALSIQAEEKTTFKVGDSVIYRNDYGVNWGEKTIVEIDKDRPGFYYIAPTETPWAPVNEKNLKLFKTATKAQQKKALEIRQRLEKR